MTAWTPQPQDVVIDMDGSEDETRDVPEDGGLYVTTTSFDRVFVVFTLPGLQVEVPFLFGFNDPIDTDVYQLRLLPQTASVRVFRSGA
jgi:hypothetical protein